MRAAARRAIARTRLLQRIRVVRPRLLWLVAPAGWGKTTFANGLLAKSGNGSLCDCRGVGNVGEFARRLLAGLDDAARDVRALPFQQSFFFERDRGGAPDGAVQRWAQDCGPTTFVFDNAECLSGEPALLSFLGALLRHPHPTRRVVIATRVALDVASSGFAPPNEVLTLGAHDLRFDDAEISKLFGGMLDVPSIELRPQQLVAVPFDRYAAHHIAQATAGWPIAVLLLARAAHEGRLSAALTEMRESPSPVLVDYFKREIVERSDAREQDALIAAATFESAAAESARGIAAAWALPGTLNPSLCTTPFIEAAVSEGGRAVLHPLLRTLVAAAYGARARSLATEHARRLRERGESAEAARLYVWLGDPGAAAVALRDCPPFLCGALDRDVAEVLAGIEGATLEHHPVLWSAATFVRLGTTEYERWLEECRRMYERLPAAGSMRRRLGVTCAYAYAAGVLGRFEEGHSALAALLAGAAGANPVDRDAARAFATLWFAAYDLWRGEPVDLERLQRTIEPLLADAGLRTLWTCEVLAFRCRMYGDRFGERIAFEAAQEAAAQCGLPAVRGFVRSDVAFSAWLAGEDDRFEQLLAAMEGDPVTSRYGDARFLVDCARGRGETAVAQNVTPRRRCHAHLIAAAVARDRTRATIGASAALEAADEARSAFHQVIARVALALLDETRTGQLVDDALRIAKEHRNFALEAALESLRANSASATMLTPLCKRFERFRHEPSTRLALSLASLTVFDAGNAVALSPRETAVLVRLALAPDPVSARMLSADLWPVGRGAATAAKACVARLRQKLGDGAVLELGPGYALGPDVSVDLFAAERMLRSTVAGTPAAARERSVLERSRILLHPRFPAYGLAWTWFAPYAERVRTAYRDTVVALASDALLRDDLGAADAYAQELLAHDPCDERGCEIALGAARRRGDSNAALAAFRRYEAALRSELGIAPPERLRVLLRATLQHARRGLRVV
ncbi:MAG: hypothetical protein M3R44_02570 [Candidatus Eremiobacteraeota bacterium]|nr:hypothetical protein [Candidatus Eremiobacteraeota bacterium]